MRLEDCQFEVDRLLLEVDSPHCGRIKIINWSHRPNETSDHFIFTSKVTILSKNEGGMQTEFEVSEMWSRNDLEKMKVVEEFSDQRFGPAGSLAMKICDLIYTRLEGKTFGDVQLEAVKAGQVMSHLRRTIEKRKSDAKWK